MHVDVVTVYIPVRQRNLRSSDMESWQNVYSLFKKGNNRVDVVTVYIPVRQRNLRSSDMASWQNVYSLFKKGNNRVDKFAGKKIKQLVYIQDP
jgi:hypothetical protein